MKIFSNEGPTLIRNEKFYKIIFGRHKNVKNSWKKLLWKYKGVKFYRNFWKLNFAD